MRSDSTVPLASDLNYVLAYVRDHYRPGKYATVIKSVSIPDWAERWAERWEVSKLTHTGSVQLSSQVGLRAKLGRVLEGPVLTIECRESSRDFGDGTPFLVELLPVKP